MSGFALVCLILSILLYSSYIIVVYIKYKPSCISESYYKIKHGYMFTVWMLLVSFLIFPSWVECSPICFQFLPFLSSVALGIVGLNPKYLGSDRVAHIIATGITATISLIWNIVTGIYIIPILLLIGVIILWLTKVKNPIFWTECAAFLNIYLSIFLS